MNPKPALVRALQRLNAARVDYVMIGVMAINHYAKDPSAVYSTLDCDILLRRDPANLLRALRALLQDGRDLRVLGEPLGKIDSLICRRIVERHGLVTAEKTGEMPIDVVLEIKGAEFPDLKKRRRVFTVAGVRVPCADLRDVLDAKQRAGRDKDLAFLKLYGAASGEPRLRLTLTAAPRRRRRTAIGSAKPRA